MTVTSTVLSITQKGKRDGKCPTLTSGLLVCARTHAHARSTFCVGHFHSLVSRLVPCLHQHSRGDGAGLCWEKPPPAPAPAAGTGTTASS